jgi:general nucleoside transport system ATP-binding protein
VVRRQRGGGGEAVGSPYPDPALRARKELPEGERTQGPAIELRAITKRFGDVVAIDGASFAVARGEIHALLGENGAGKTSLMNVLAGIYRPDAGEILVGGRTVEITDPEDAKRLGIGMVHQEQRLVGRFTAPENVSIGHRDPPWLTLNRFFRRLAQRLSERYRLAIDHGNPVWDLPIGRRQRVELVKLLHHGARVLILDEPTANLAPAEVEAFFEAVRDLANQGHAIVFITHKLDEVIRYTDRVTVMRGGRAIATMPTSGTTRDRLNREMVGELEPSSTGVGGKGGEVVLEIRGLRVEVEGGRVALQDVDLQARAGEVLAVAGVAGNGQTQLAEAITGHVRGYQGAIRVLGREAGELGARGVAQLGVAYVPEDRREVGLVGGQSVAVNLALRRFDRAPYSRGGWIDHAAIRRDALALIERYGIRPPDPDLPVARLSGGNQQRVIIAREFAGNPRLIVADNFTRGLDPRSTQLVTDELFAHRDRGAAVVWVTSDLNEALVCDRIAVINRGRIVAVLDRSEATGEQIGLLMSGDVANAA